ncbi:hypothetical protein JZO79_11930 [Vagococcus fluvialis]|uniref:hypothetical protein n=1 Tax=Vagococcus fluvialis TaxID=2738 RepID=UPI001A8DC666|nr:hypothetical protein [Vagococcus fluvialis]MBO0444323.1 hypothetical protein [Vagococcus fluvialis]
MNRNAKKILGALGLGIAGLILREFSNRNNEEIEIPNNNYREKCFNGIPESYINDIAMNVSRGVKAVVENENLVVFYYKSRSGKQLLQSDNVLNEDGTITYYPGGGSYATANAPRMFADDLANEFN